jgi:thymidylate synthase
LFLGDYHLYLHLVQAKRQILRTPKQFPKLIIKNPRTNIEDFEFEDFVLEGYEPDGFIQAKMIA